MNLILESRWVSFVIRVGDGRKVDDDDDELVVVSGGNFEIARPDFGFQWTEEGEDE